MKQSIARFLPNGSLVLTPEQTAALGVYLLASCDDEYEALGLNEEQARLCSDIAGAFYDVREASAVLATYRLADVRSASLTVAG